MTSPGHDFPSLDELPIPEDVRPGPGWTGQMLEMADHIGAHATLLISSRYGGQYVYVAADPARNVFRSLVGAETAAIISDVYGTQNLKIPTAKYALARARRRAIIASVRAGELSAADAARILKTSRTYLSFLVNQSDEFDPWEGPVAGRPRVRQPDLFGPGDGDNTQ